LAVLLSDPKIIPMVKSYFLLAWCHLLKIRGYSPIHIAAVFTGLAIFVSKPAEELKKVCHWIDCGDDDFLTKGIA
jgi:hypothetical protein